MHISLLSTPDNGVIAREELVGEFGGEFYRNSVGEIYYRHEADKQQWYVNRDLQAFRASVAALERWRAAVVQTADDAEQRRLVQCLQEALVRIESLGDSRVCYWPVILEQILV